MERAVTMDNLMGLLSFFHTGFPSTPNARQQKNCWGKFLYQASEVQWDWALRESLLLDFPRPEKKSSELPGQPAALNAAHQSCLPALPLGPVSSK